MPVCPPVSPCKGASIGNGCASCVIYKHFYAWKRLLCGWGICSLQMETSPLRMGTCSLRMETSLRGRSGGHTGAAPTISRVAPCPKVGGRGSADGLKQEKVAGRGSADGLKRKTHLEKRISGVGFRLNMLRKWLSWRLDCEILHFFIIFAAEKIKPI